MSEAKHTPGPWTLFEDVTTDEGGMPIRATDPTDDCVFRVADVYGVDIDTEHCAQAKANARLIAAAPELLEALKITRGNIASLGPAGALTPYTSYQEWLAMVDDVIAKATGGQP